MKPREMAPAVAQPARRRVLGLPLAALFATPAGALRVQAPAWRDAVADYRAGRLADAFGRFHELANDGDAEAAAVALFMYRFGPLLYGRYWDATPQEVRSWETLQASIAARVQRAYDADATDPAAPPPRGAGRPTLPRGHQVHR